MGVSADELAAAKRDDEDAFKARIKAARFSTWALDLGTKSREYQVNRICAEVESFASAGWCRESVDHFIEKKRRQLQYQ